MVLHANFIITFMMSFLVENNFLTDQIGLTSGNLGIESFHSFKVVSLSTLATS
jgi:hypothetical protein